MRKEKPFSSPSSTPALPRSLREQQQELQGALERGPGDLKGNTSQGCPGHHWIHCKRLMTCCSVCHWRSFIQVQRTQPRCIFSPSQCWWKRGVMAMGVRSTHLGPSLKKSPKTNEKTLKNWSYHYEWKGLLRSQWDLYLGGTVPDALAQRIYLELLPSLQRGRNILILTRACGYGISVMGQG